VRGFYEQAAADESLQAIFNAAIQNWDAHHQVVENFWSRTLLERDRYRDSPYPLHVVF
jgi:hemoglobin